MHKIKILMVTSNAITALDIEQIIDEVANKARVKPQYSLALTYQDCFKFEFTGPYDLVVVDNDLGNTTTGKDQPHEFGLPLLRAIIDQNRYTSATLVGLATDMNSFEKFQEAGITVFLRCPSFEQIASLPPFQTRPKTKDSS